MKEPIKKNDEKYLRFLTDLYGAKTPIKVIDYAKRYRLNNTISKHLLEMDLIYKVSRGVYVWCGGQPTMTTVKRLKQKHSQYHHQKVKPKKEKNWYYISEVAKMVGKTDRTLRSYLSKWKEHNDTGHDEMFRYEIDETGVQKLQLSEKFIDKYKSHPIIKRRKEVIKPKMEIKKTKEISLFWGMIKIIY